MIKDLTVDFHAHILPGCDHGSSDIKTSVTQLNMAKEAGISTVCATSHFYPNKDTVDGFLKRRAKCYERLKSRLPEKAPKILLGAEVLICDGMEHMEDLDRLCLEGTNFLLLEMPFFKWSESLIETALSISERDDLQVIIAHADRYPKEAIEVFIDNNIPLQLNAKAFNSVLHRKRYIKWVQKGYVKYLGSDIHGTKDVYKYFSKSIKLLGKIEKFESHKKTTL